MKVQKGKILNDATLAGAKAFVMKECANDYCHKLYWDEKDQRCKAPESKLVLNAINYFQICSVIV